MRTFVVRIAFAVLVLTTVAAIAITCFGGVDAVWWGHHITATRTGRLWLLAAACAVVLVASRGWPIIDADTRRLVVRTPPTPVALVLAIAAVAVSARFNSWTASGPDSFAYVSQAALFRDGRLSIPAPLARRAPWPEATTTFAPYGYRAAARGEPALVPITAPGVPLVMAALETVFGDCAAFVVTPIAAGVLVLATFAIGRRLRSPATGVIAAWLVATSPAVLFMMMWPMTDVPAAAVTAVMVWLVMRTTDRAALAAGLVGSFALLARPNIVVIAVGISAWLIAERVWWSAPEGRRRIWAFATGLVPGAAVMAWMNWRLFGSPMASGYGSAGSLLSISHAWTNVSRYTAWLLETSPIAAIGVAAMALPVAAIWRAHGKRDALLFAIVSSAALLPYIFYGDFTDWWYLRFLLPAWPVVFVAAAAAIDWVRQRGAWGAAATTLAVLFAGLSGIHFAYARGVFAFGERRYVSVARVVANATEPDAVVLTGQHCGTVRFYAGRETIRWDMLDPAWLDRAIAWLDSQNRHAYILVEDWELPQFEARFGRTNAFGNLSFAPVAAWQSATVEGWIYLFDPQHTNATTLIADPAMREDFCARPASGPGIGR